MGLLRNPCRFFEVLGPPSGFSSISKKNGGAERRRILHTYQRSFCTFSENFVPRSSQFRSPGQVKWPYLPKSLWCYRGYRFWAIIMKLLGCDELSLATKFIPWIFLFRWPKARPILWPPHYKVMGAKPNHPVRIRSGSFVMNLFILGYCWWSRCKFWSVIFIEVIWGQPRSSTGFC